MLNYCFLIGGDLASTWVAKPEEHVEHITCLVKPVVTFIVGKQRKNRVAANDANGALEVAKAA